MIKLSNDFLYRNSYKVLEGVNYLYKQDGTVSLISIAVYFNNKVSDLDLESTLLYLKDKEYIKIEKDEINQDLFIPTHIGKHYGEMWFQVIKEFLLKSVLVPIIVTVITYAITKKLIG